MPPAVVVGAIGAVASVARAGIASNQQRKAQQSAENFARDQAEAARAEQRRLEEKFGLTPGELERQDRLFEAEAEQQAELERRASLSGEELIREEGQIPTALLDEIQGRLGKTGEELFAQEGEVNRQFIDEITNFDEELFNKELGLVLDQVNAEANRRGVFVGLPEGGIRFENLGRAGVDLAIKKAAERLNQRAALSEAFVNLAQGSRAEAGTVSERALGAGDLSRQELNTFLANLQQADLASKGRAANVALGGFNTAQGAVNQFSSVPIQFDALRFGEAGAIKQQGLEALGDIAGIGINQAINKSSPKPTGGIDEFLAKDRDPLSGLLERTGGIDLFYAARKGRAF